MLVLSLGRKRPSDNVFWKFRFKGTIEMHSKIHENRSSFVVSHLCVALYLFESPPNPNISPVSAEQM